LVSNLICETKLAIVAYENNDKKVDSVFSSRVKAGKRRTYFFDVRETRGNDYYLTITESRKRTESEGYNRHKIFLYKEDFNKFLKGLTEAIDHVKTELMPDFNFDAFNHDTPYEMDENAAPSQHSDGTDDAQNGGPAGEQNSNEMPDSKPNPPADSLHTEEVDKW